MSDYYVVIALEFNVEEICINKDEINIWGRHIKSFTAVNWNPLIYSLTLSDK